MSTPINVKQNPDGSWTAAGGTSLTVVSVTCLTEHKAVAGHAAAITALLSRGNGWIKCSDRLPDMPDPAHPDCSENVLIFVDGHTQFGFIGLDDDPNWYLGNGDLIEEAIVTHWQPLPSAPTE